MYLFQSISVFPDPSPSLVRWNNTGDTLDRDPKALTPRIPCGLNIRKKRKEKKKPDFLALLNPLVNLPKQKMSQF